MNDFKYNVTKHVTENGNLILICPDITIESKVNWCKDSKHLNSSFRNNMAESMNEPHLTIDAYNALYILHATKTDEGVYSCIVDGKTIQNFSVKVDPKYRFLNQDFIRHSMYLGFVLSLTMTCYCAGICVAWQRRASFADPLNLMRRKHNYSFEERKRLIKD
ncbi:uncharacterized protein [Choristoneura fumiferana]|uniref:uncharacterized protein n=1 Tax=Choristoneura fumiferana TaxID=7141 RepID=UPI003D1557E5